MICVTILWIALLCCRLEFGAELLLLKILLKQAWDVQVLCYFVFKCFVA